MNKILAVDKDIDFHKQRIEELAKYNITALRVDTMHEAITQLISGDKFFFIVINEDTIIDFMEQLPIMRDITDITIVIFTNSYTIEKRLKAMSFGADLYESHNAYISDNFFAVLELLKKQKRWAQQQFEPLPLLVYGDIILSPPRRSVYVKGIEVSLTKLEFDILEYLMSNHGIILTHQQILYTIWGDEYEEASYEVLRNAIKRLREKLRILPDSPNYIENEREVGYFLTYNTID